MARALGLKHAGCPHLPYCTVRSGSSRLGLGKLTPAPKRGWAHRNTRQACPGMEFLPGNSDFLSPNLEAQGDSVVSTSVLPCTARRLLSPPGASPHVSPLTLGFAATQSSPRSCTHGFPSFFLQTMAWPGPWKHAATAGPGSWLYGWHLRHPPQPGSHRQRPISQLEKLRHREVKDLAYSLVAGKCRARPQGCKVPSCLALHLTGPLYTGPLYTGTSPP